MVMRYHWGLAVGHIYTHAQMTSRVEQSKNGSTSATHDGDMDWDAMPTTSGSIMLAAEDFQEDGSDKDSQQAEQELSGYNDDELEYADLLSGDDDGEGPEDCSDDDMLLAMDDMYGAGSNDY